MADQEIKFTTRRCGAELRIRVDHEAIKTKKNKKILFINGLDGPTPVQLQFFTAGEAKTNPVSGVCDGIDGATVLISGPSFECKLTKGGMFKHESLAYTVSTPSNSHQPLDPVIIIQPSVFVFTLPLAAIFGGIVAAVAGLIAYRVGLRRGRAAAS